MNVKFSLGFLLVTNPITWNIEINLENMRKPNLVHFLFLCWFSSIEYLCLLEIEIEVRILSTFLKKFSLIQIMNWKLYISVSLSLATIQKKVCSKTWYWNWILYWILEQLCNNRACWYDVFSSFLTLKTLFSF